MTTSKPSAVTPISPVASREDLIAMIHHRDALVSALKESLATRSAQAPGVLEALDSVALKIAEEISQLRHYRDEEFQIEHARIIAEGRISQAEMDLRWVKEARAVLSDTSERGEK